MVLPDPLVRQETPPPDTARGATADLCDVHVTDPVDVVTEGDVQICEAVRYHLLSLYLPPSSCCTYAHDPLRNLSLQGYFKDLGGNLAFSGEVATVKCFENNPLVRKALEEDGRGRVLVVDGGASRRCALLGDNIAEMAYKNGWSGIIINGCIRDSADIARMPLGVKAITTYPLKSSKRDLGLRDVAVTFAGATFRPGDWVHADGDGVLVSKKGSLS